MLLKEKENGERKAAVGAELGFARTDDVANV